MSKIDFCGGADVEGYYELANIPKCGQLLFMGNVKSVYSIQ